MSQDEAAVWLTGIVLAERRNSDARGKQFLGAVLECQAGMVWVLDYAELSPFHAFAGQPVVVSGHPYEPESGEQHLISWSAGKKLGHFRVSTVRPAGVIPDTAFLEIRARKRLRGRLESARMPNGDTTLSFVTIEGDTFPVVNYPTGITVGTTLEVCAYPVQPSPSMSRSHEEHLWIVGQYSSTQLWE